MQDRYWYTQCYVQRYIRQGGCHPAVEAMSFIANKIYDELGPWIERSTLNRTVGTGFEQYDDLLDVPAF